MNTHDVLAQDRKINRIILGLCFILLLLILLTGCADNTARFKGGEWVSASVSKVTDDPCMIMIMIRSTKIGDPDLALQARLQTKECK